MKRPLAFLLLLLAGSLATDSGGSAAEPPAISFLVIVHSSNATASLTKSEISHLFLKKLTKWKDGRPVVPVDLLEDAAVRRSFSREILGRGAPAIKSYWQQQIFSGRGVPPREVDSDEDVVRIVSQSPGAIGYVSAAASLDGVKPVRVEDR